MRMLRHSEGLGPGRLAHHWHLTNDTPTHLPRDNVSEHYYSPLFKIIYLIYEMSSSLVCSIFKSKPPVFVWTITLFKRFFIWQVTTSQCFGIKLIWIKDIYWIKLIWIKDIYLKQTVIKIKCSFFFNFFTNLTVWSFIYIIWMPWK